METHTYTLRELAELVGGELNGDGDTPIRGVAGIKEAGQGEITFLANLKYKSFLKTTRASAVIGPCDMEFGIPAIQIENPYMAFLKVLTRFVGERSQRYPREIHENTVVDPTAELGDDLSIGPNCQIGPGATIGARTTILAGTYIGKDVSIGENCMLYSNVTVRERCAIGARVILHPGVVIGADGFGFAKEGQIHQKIPQVGRVVIEDDVEIGANSTVDRATIGETRVCAGSKIDNLVQIAHNVIIGKNSVIAAQVGIAGSTEIGDGVVMAGQVGLVGHIKIGDGVIIAAQAGVSKSATEGMVLSGHPARDHNLQRRIFAYTARLPELYNRIKELERRVAEFEKAGDNDSAAKDD